MRGTEELEPSAAGPRVQVGSAVLILLFLLKTYKDSAADVKILGSGWSGCLQPRWSGLQ